MAAEKKLETQEDRTAKRGKRTLLALLLVTALFIAGLAFHVQQQEAPEGIYAQTSPAKAQLIASSVAENLFFTYYDEEYDFELRYPSGYKAEENPDFGVRLRFTAANPYSTYDKMLSGTALSIAVNTALAPTQLAENAFQGTLNQVKTTASDGKIFVTAETTGLINENEKIFLRATFYSCKKRDGTPYTATAIAAIPESLLAEENVLKLAIGSLNCTGG